MPHHGKSFEVWVDLHPLPWLDVMVFTAATTLFIFVAGEDLICIPNNAKSRLLLENFWANYRNTCPDHKVYSQHPGPLNGQSFHENMWWGIACYVK